MSIKGLHFVRKKLAGKPTRWYVYAWRGGPCITMSISEFRPRLDQKAIERFSAACAQRTSVPLTTINGLAVAWRASPEWSAFADDTKRMWRRTLDAITEEWGNVPLAAFEDMRIRPKIVEWRDKMAKTPRKADYHVGVLRSLLNYGIMIAAISHNRAAGISTLYKGGNRAAIIWEPEEITEFLAVAEQHVADAFNFARLTGLRRSDLVAIPWSAVKENAIVWPTKKSGRVTVVSFPLIPQARALLDQLRTRNRKSDVDTILVNSRGRAWSPDGLNSSFNGARARTTCRKHIHDLRGTAVTEWCNAGISNEKIAGAFGWKPARVAEIIRLYVDQAGEVVAIGNRLADASVNQTVNRVAQ